jgi:hypothetical protein
VFDPCWHEDHQRHPAQDLAGEVTMLVTFGTDSAYQVEEIWEP